MRAVLNRSWLWAAALALASAAGPAAVAAPLDLVAQGERIYRLGEGSDGHPLRAEYGSGTRASGAAMACIACHRGSGLGGIEGEVSIPPITGRALFGTGDPVVVRYDLRIGAKLSAPHAAYDEAAFARIIRAGRDPAGRELNALMPRYALGERELRAVAAYLKTLSVSASPGVDTDTIHVATVIAPGVAPARREAFLATLNAFVSQANLSVRPGQRQKLSMIERRAGQRRKWSLEVWELSGPANGWQAQLEAHQQSQPAFVLLSGLADGEWQPVQDFCERHRVGCWFPSVDILPRAAERGRYALYFSGGVGTDAAVVAHALRGAAGRVLQVVGADVRAREGVAALRVALGSAGRQLTEVAASDVAGLATALAAISEDDAVVLWLTPEELERLPVAAPAAHVYLSGVLAGAEAVAVPHAWRMNATMAQQLERPSLRVANTERFRAWLSGMHIALVDLKMQSEVYFAARFLLETSHTMLQNTQADYLIERGETMLAPFETMLVRDEVQATMMSPMNKRPAGAASAPPDPAAASAARAHLDEMLMRGGTTVYPRLSLASGQRVAAKGGYLEKLDADGAGIVGEPEWVVP